MEFSKTTLYNFEVVKPAHEECSRTYWNNHTSDAEIKGARACFGSKMVYKAMLDVKKIIEEHRGVKIVVFNFPGFLCVFVDEDTDAIYAKGKLIPKILFGKEEELYKDEAWYRGMNTDTFSSEVNLILLKPVHSYPIRVCSELAYDIFEEKWNKWWTKVPLVTVQDI